jgi:hypothetical protein
MGGKKISSGKWVEGTNAERDEYAKEGRRRRMPMPQMFVCVCRSGQLAAAENGGDLCFVESWGNDGNEKKKWTR